jgi:hypothetical protein
MNVHNEIISQVRDLAQYSDHKESDVTVVLLQATKEWPDGGGL